jgi:hypothetical protein
VKATEETATQFIWNWPQGLCLHVDNDDGHDIYCHMPKRFTIYRGNKSLESLHCICNEECLYQSKVKLIPRCNFSSTLYPQSY